ncbi:hypothetical protein [Marinifilum caeruleilacunae]|uniref:Uncharacterized protein n=1 Tax=Marinifilum caeruleilacunae TaxID=2499076 RepID=A0ABX1WUX9_9BACT|nr:hypothetical protein [Marinifilum caeruleilacunae]NOU59708.1 hypothetical protein [Marinifilum caeruleilacunae]
MIKNQLPYTSTFLLSWEFFELIICENPRKYFKLESNQYPINIFKEDYNSQVIEESLFYDTGIRDNSSGSNHTKKVPVTFFDAPFKMFLSPFQEQSSSELFFSSSNKEQQLLKTRRNEKIAITRLVKLWSNNLRSNSEHFITEFKAIGYAGTDIQIEPRPNFLPSELQRKEISTLTTRYQQTIKTDFFEVTGLGLSSDLIFKNNIHSIPYSLSKWEQFIHFGRTNFTNIESLGFDANTGIKLIINEIDSREFKRGKSYVRRRFYVQFLENEVTIKNNELFKIPFQRIIPIEHGSFFKPVYHSEIGNEGIIVLNEGPNSAYPSDLLKFKYRGIDHLGVSKEFEMDMIIIPERLNKITSGVYVHKNGWEGNTEYQEGTYVRLHHAAQITEDSSYSVKSESFHTYGARAIQVINEFRARNEKHHRIEIKEKLAFAASGNVNEDSINLETKGILLYTYFDNSFSSNNNVRAFNPRLAYVKAKIPNLVGIESSPQTYNLMYAESYMNHGFSEIKNASKVFMKSLKRNFNAGLDIDYGDYIKSMRPQQQSIVGIFSQNNRNSGAVINPDFPIEGLSISTYGLLSKESYNDKIKRNGVTGGHRFNPADFLGKDAELIGGIKLINLLEQFLEDPDHPKIKVTVDKIKDFKAVLKDFNEIYNIWKKEVREAQKLISSLPLELDNIKREIENEIRSQILTSIERYLEKLKLKTRIESNLKLKVDDLQIKELFEFEREIQNNLIQSIIKEIQIDDYIDVELINQIQELSKILISRDVESYIEKKNVVSQLILKFIKKQPFYGQIQKNKEQIFKMLYLDFFEKVLVTNSSDSFTAKVNLEPVKDILLELKPRIEKKYEGRYLQLLESVDETIIKTEKHWEKANVQVTDELQNLKEQIGDLTLLKTIEIAQTFDQVNDQYLQTVNALKGTLSSYASVMKEIGINQEIIDKIIKEQEAFFDAKLQGLTKNLKARALSLKKRFKDEAAPYIERYNDLENDVLVDIETYKQRFQFIFEDYKGRIEELLKKIDARRQGLQGNYDQKLAKLKEAENTFNDSVYAIQNAIDGEVEQLLEKLNNSIRGTEEYEELKKAIDTYKELKYLVNAPFKQDITYTFSTHKLRNFDGGLVKFIARNNPNSSIEIDFKSSIYFNITSPSVIEKQETTLSNTIRSFGLNILGLITVDFDEISFSKSRNGIEALNIKIRDIQFDGDFRFISFFEEGLKSINKSNMILNVNSNGVSVGFQYPLGPIAFGYLNLSNLHFNILFTMPFMANAPMQIEMGINNPKNKFLAIVNGYPGAGYFIMNMNPKEGITHVVFLIEFESNETFDLGLAYGSTSLLGGIYFQKNYSEVELKAYILCHGNFRVLGLFNSSITFNVLLRYAGNDLSGSCVVRVKHSFSSWFEVEAEVYMSHTIKGKGKKNLMGTAVCLDNLTSIKANLLSESEILELFEDRIVDSNLTSRINYKKGETLYLIYRIGREEPESSKVILKSNSGSVSFNEELIENDESTDSYYFLITGELVQSGTQCIGIERNAKTIWLNSSDIKLAEDFKNTWSEYFSSCYY